ncbi:sigma-54 interaction domain-containing protein [Oleiphilus messinensis]|uniref:sigma-54 interaction domain-containing protein n=1 Tax=Oleiphilus messinensis TaxID=141451 RepID=UPI001E50B37A|nr:sigma 54-interacting transcriptional regulator [Oleiphilus messinensis]
MTKITLAADADQDLEHLKQRYELILQAMGEGVYGLNERGLTTFVNKAAEDMTGWPAQDLLGKVVHDFHHHTKVDGSPYPSRECPIYQTLQDGIGRHVDHEVFWRKDGTRFPVEYISTAIVRAGRIIGAVIVFKDISERRESEQRLQLALQQVEQLKEQLQAENRYLMDEIREEYNFSNLIGQSPSLKHILSQIEHVAPTLASVLIQGESGTGKELIARAIHDASDRKDRPLVKVNCGAITPSLVESELFGHEKGAFTGALQKRLGRFELAHGGTLFLDEVGELPLDIQVKLLRVLQEGEFERVGSSATRQVDVRIIAATNRPIQGMIERGEFRSDLYYRLSVFPIQVPSLRQRQEDIPLLAEHTLRRLNQKIGKKFTAISNATLKRFKTYHWPGNIRELQNVIERAAIVGSPPELDVTSLPGLAVNSDSEAQVKTAALDSFPTDGDIPENTAPVTLLTLVEVERQHIIRALEHTNWIIAGKLGAAEMLGMPPSTLRSRMKKLDIVRA